MSSLQGSFARHQSGCRAALRPLDGLCSVSGHTVVDRDLLTEFRADGTSFSESPHCHLGASPQPGRHRHLRWNCRYPGRQPGAVSGGVCRLRSLGCVASGDEHVCSPFFRKPVGTAAGTSAHDARFSAHGRSRLFGQWLVLWPVQSSHRRRQWSLVRTDGSKHRASPRAKGSQYAPSAAAGTSVRRCLRLAVSGQQCGAFRGVRRWIPAGPSPASRAKAERPATADEWPRIGRSFVGVGSAASGHVFRRIETS